jgi:hypothetical protein
MATADHQNPAYQFLMTPVIQLKGTNPVGEALFTAKNRPLKQKIIQCGAGTIIANFRTLEHFQKAVATLSFRPEGEILAP